MHRIAVIFSFILGVFGIICFYKLNTIPGEWYGDISIEHEYTTSILGGKWPIHYSLSAGPVYHYLITPVIALVGSSYYGYKIASVLTGIVGVVLLFIFARAMWGERVGLFASAGMAFSFWFVVWSRLGSSPQILSPVLLSLSLLGLTQWYKTRRESWLMTGGFMSALGFLSYPALYVLPFIYLFLVLAGSKTRVRSLVLTFVAMSPVFVLFIYIFWTQSNLFSHGYIGEKLLVSHTIPQVITSTLVRYVETWGALFFKGDATFRINIPGRAHLDIVSQLLFILGIVTLLLKRNTWEKCVVFVPLLVLPIPSIVPGIPAAEIPSSSRTLAMIPLVYILVGLGCDTVYVKAKKYVGAMSLFVPFLICTAIIAMTLYTYFGAYTENLPNHNAAYGRQIAQLIDAHPQVPVYFTGCCWGEAGEPEPKAIYNALKQKQGRSYIVDPTFVRSCSDLSEHFLLIIDPTKSELVKQFVECFPQAKRGEVVDGYGQHIYSYLLKW